jgi:hypothetical protein
MSGMLWRASARHLARHPWQIGLSVLGIALGVAVALSIDLANASARRSFALFAEGVAGRATHHVVGGPTGVPESVYRALRVEAGLRRSAPVVERHLAAPDFPGTAFHLMGVDPFAEAPFRSLWAGRQTAPGRRVGPPGPAGCRADRPRYGRRLGLTATPSPCGSGARRPRSGGSWCRAMAERAGARADPGRRHRHRAECWARRAG